MVEQMKATPVNDFFAKNGTIRDDGRMVHDMYLARVKSPDESSGKWDYYEILRTIPGDEAYLPLVGEHNARWSTSRRTHGGNLCCPWRPCPDLIRACGSAGPR